MIKIRIFYFLSFTFGRQERSSPKKHVSARAAPLPAEELSSL